MPEVPPAGGSGTLRFLLMDHLGGTVEVLDSSGATVSELKYWPFGATRSGSITQTDKLYTGQQQEPGDAALGLYNYKARFYSTTIGRFLSADPTSDGLNRYRYVANNPLRYVDPSGLALGVGCGWQETCERGNGGTQYGGDIEDYRSIVTEYWASPASRVNFGDNNLDFIFDLFAGALSNPLYFRWSDIVEIFDVMIFDSSPSRRETDARAAAGRFGWRVAESPYEINYFVGFSFGAITISEYLYLNRNGSLGFRESVHGVYLYAGPDGFRGFARTTNFDIGSHYPNAYVIARSSREWFPGFVRTGKACKFKVCVPTYGWSDEAIDPHYPGLTGGVDLREEDAGCGHHYVDVDLSRGDACEMFHRRPC